MAAANFTSACPTRSPRRLRGGFERRDCAHILAVSSLAELSAEGLAAVGPPARLIAEYERFPRTRQAVRERGL